MDLPAESPQLVILIPPSANSPSNNICKLLNINWDKDVYEEYSDKTLDEIVEGLSKDQTVGQNYRDYVKARRPLWREEKTT